jgi:hypothetical protein
MGPIMSGKDLTQILDKLQQELHVCASNVYEIVDPIVASTEQEKLTTHLQLYAVMKFVKDTIGELETMVNKNMPIVAGRAEKLMTQEGIEEMKFAGLVFSPDKKNFISVTAANAPAVMEWLKQHPIGREMIKLGYHPKTFESFIKKEFIEKGEKPPSIISIFPQPVLDVRKARS